MADSTINGLGAATALDGTETVPAWQGAATVKASVQQINTAVTGAAGMSGATETTSKPLLNHAQTWNNVATTFTGWKVNVTDTASASASLLADLQVGGTSKFNVRKDGTVFMGLAGSTWSFSDSGGGVLVIANSGTATHQFGVGFGAARMPSTGLYGWTANTAVTVGADTAFGRTSAKVAELNSGTAGAYTGTAFLLGPQTVAQLPAAAAALKGARATVTDATTTTFLGALTGGGSNIVPVFCNGTAWVIG